MIATILNQESIEATYLSFKDIAWLAGTTLVFLTIYFIFKDRRDKRHENKIAKIELEKREQVEKLKIEKEAIEQREREDKKYQQERYDKLITEERIRHNDALLKREEEVRTLSSIGNQITKVSETVLKIEGMMDSNKADIRKLTEDFIENKGSVKAAWTEIEKHSVEIKDIKDNCWEVQQGKIKENK
jgi:endo-alpha-1,4-polygalactosaminidase (GH114 family)